MPTEYVFWSRTRFFSVFLMPETNKTYEQNYNTYNAGRYDVVLQRLRR